MWDGITALSSATALLFVELDGAPKLYLSGEDENLEEAKQAIRKGRPPLLSLEAGIAAARMKFPPTASQYEAFMKHTYPNLVIDAEAFLANRDY